MSRKFAPPKNERSLAREPSLLAYAVDRTFSLVAILSAFAILLLVAYILYEIGRQAAPAVSAKGLNFLYGVTWDVQKGEFGILPQIWGTLYSSLLALLIGGFVGVTIAIFLTQDFLPPQFAVSFRTVIEMLAAIPSVVFGLWGIFVVIPFLRPGAAWLHDHFGEIPFFSTSLSGPGLLPAAIVLSIMILPTVAAISQDAIGLVPYKIKEAAYGMGWTTREVVKNVVIPYTRVGIIGGVMLGLGRALGETMAVTFVIGNAHRISGSILAPGTTISATIANEFTEAVGDLYTSSLIALGLILFFITFVVLALARLMLMRIEKKAGA